MHPRTAFENWESMHSSLAQDRPAGQFGLRHLLGSGFFKVLSPALPRAVRPSRYWRGHRHAKAVQFRAFAASIALIGQALYAQTPSGSRQQNPLKTMTLDQLGSIEVTTVSKVPEEMWNTPAAIYVITQEDIQRSGAMNIPEALRLAPGVEVARITSGEYAIGIRGFNSRLSRSVLVLIDGRTVYSTFTAGTYWETQDVLMKDIDRIEVIRGPGGTIWGPNAVNGVINIITKNTKDTQGVLGTGGGGDIEQVLGDARFGSGNGRGLTYRVYVKGFGWAPQYHSDGDNYDDWHGGQGGFRMDWDAHGRDSFRLQGDVYGQEFGEKIVGTTYSPPANTEASGDASLYGGNILWNWTRGQGEGRDIQLAAYYDHTTRNELNFGDIRNSFNVDFLDRFRLPHQQISWGITARASHGNEVEIFSGLTFTPSQRTDQLYQGFVQDEISLVKNRLSIVAGTKVVKTNYTGVLAEPNVRVLYTPTSTQTLWMAYTHGLRTPADVERDFNLSSYLGNTSGGMPIFARFSANPNFRSEQLNGYELGYRGLEGRQFYVDIAGFYNHYGDLFSEDLVTAPYVETTPPPTHVLIPAQFGNGLVASTTGVEVAPTWRPEPWWRLGGSYSLLEMHVKKGTGSKDIGSASTVQGSSPEHQALVQSGFDLPKSVSLDIQLRYVRALPGINVPSYLTANSKVQWVATRHIRLSAVGENLFQPHHVEFNYDPGPLVGIRRGFYGQITFTK
jgi:iron complex outermembrane receptor protein